MSEIQNKIGSNSYFESLVSSFIVEQFECVDNNAEKVSFANVLNNVYFEESYRSMQVNYNIDVDDVETMIESLKYGSEFKLVIKDRRTKEKILDKSLILVKINRRYQDYLKKNGRYFNLEFVEKAYFEYIKAPYYTFFYNDTNGKSLKDIIDDIFTKHTTLNTFTKELSEDLSSYKYNELLVHGKTLDFITLLLQKFPTYFYYSISKTDVMAKGKFNIKTNTDIKNISNDKFIKMSYMPIYITIDQFNSIQKNRNQNNNQDSDSYFTTINEVNPLDYIDNIVGGKRFSKILYGDGTIKSSESGDEFSTYEEKLSSIGTQKTLYKPVADTIEYRALFNLQNENNPLITYEKELTKRTVGTYWDYEYAIDSAKYNLNILDVVDVNFLNPYMNEELSLKTK